MLPWLGTCDICWVTRLSPGILVKMLFKYLLLGNYFNPSRLVRSPDLGICITVSCLSYTKVGTMLY